MIVRSEKPEDYEKIGVVQQQAFNHDLEKNLIINMRNTKEFDAYLSIVCEEGKEIIGHTLFSKVTIEDGFKSTPCILLGPLAVSPTHQAQGVGTLLVKEGLKRAESLGYTIVLVLGHTFYRKFGFSLAKHNGIFRPNPTNGEYFQVLELKYNSLNGISGVVKYPKPFNHTVYKWDTKSQHS